QQLRLQVRADQGVVGDFQNRTARELALDREVPEVLLRQAGCFPTLPPRDVVLVRERRVNEGRDRIVREALIEDHVRENSVGALVRHAEGLREAALVGGAGYCGDGAEGTAISGADNRLLIPLIGESDAGAEAVEPGVGQRLAALAAWA